MRIVSRVLTAAVTLAAVTGCVSRTGPAVIQAASQPPASSSVDGECATTDIEVTGAVGAAPKVVVPTGCAPPTSLLVQDLVRGDGPQAVVGSDIEIGYVLVTWTRNEVLDTTWSGADNLPMQVEDLGHAPVIGGWNEAIPGMRVGGRRLIVVPAGYGRFYSGGIEGADTLVYVVDAVAVTRS
jgi:peptidylprolyl isomerase